MAFIDAHAHLNSELFSEDWKGVVEKAKNDGLVAVINNGSNVSDSERSIEQAESDPIVFATIGYHPEYLAGRLPDMDQLLNNLRRLAKNHTKVVAIGELGLDYTLDPNQAPKQTQIKLIEPQLALAAELAMPVVLHVRDQKGATDCFNDVMALLKQFPTLTGQFHCWTAGPRQAEQALEAGFYLSFSGILTYPTAGHIVDVVSSAPIDRLLIETDAPYLIPEPRRSIVSRGKSQPINCIPSDVIMVAEKLASIRQMPLEEVAARTVANAKKLFRLAI